MMDALDFAASLSWAVPLLVAAAGCAAIWISKPSHWWAAVVATALTMTAGAWEAGSTFSESRIYSRIGADAHYRLTFATNDFTNTLRSIASHADPAWLPEGPAEFFGPQMPLRVCRVDPGDLANPWTKQRWDVRISGAASEFRKRLDDVLFNQGHVLDEALYQTVSSLRHSTILAYFEIIPWGIRAQHELDPSRKQNLCHGLEQKFIEDLVYLRELHARLQAGPPDLRIQVSEPWEEMKRASRPPAPSQQGAK